MRALEGIRVLDLTHVVSGPYAGMMLADLGAETIKIEPPGKGEMTRRLLENDPKHSLNGMGAYFLTLNRNKKSVTLNLKSEQGLKLFYELVKLSDVVLTNFSAGVTERLRISFPHLSQVNPRIITCTITGFGETGPGKDEVALDLVVQAMGGGMSITGHEGSPPTRAGILIGDLGGGLMGVVGILSALIARERTGKGQHVDISMLDAQISLLSYLVTMNLLSGETPGPFGNTHFLHVPYNAYPCQDGYIILAVTTDPFWENLMEVLPISELDTEENKYRDGRLKNRETIDKQLGKVFQHNSREYWLEKLRAGRVPCAPVNDIADALRNPQIRHRNMVIEVNHPLGGTVEIPGNPVKLSGAGEEVYSPPPLIGEHTEAILHDLLGKSKEEISHYYEEGVI